MQPKITSDKSFDKSKAHKVLLIEDCQITQTIVKACLHSVCSITVVESLQEADRVLKSNDFDLAILDVMLPDGNGFEFCQNVLRSKKSADLPVVFLTGESHVTQKVRGFELDAEDYITKPIEPREFAARIASRLRKIESPALMNSKFLTRAQFHVDLTTHTASVLEANGQSRELGLTPTEYKLLVHFLRHEDELITREELRKAAWGDKVHVTSHTVDTHLSALRKKLGPEARYLQAVIRKGYRFSIGEQIPKGAVSSGQG